MSDKNDMDKLDKQVFLQNRKDLVFDVAFTGIFGGLTGVAAVLHESPLAAFASAGLIFTSATQSCKLYKLARQYKRDQKNNL